MYNECMAKKKPKKAKKKKPVPLPKLRAKLLRLWSEVSRENDNFACIVCGIKRGDPSPTNPSVKIKIDAHHLLQKYIKDCPLKFDIRNEASLCPKHHKFDGEMSAHKSPIVFYDWLRINHPERYEFVLNNSSIRVDLDNRKVLEEILERLLTKEPLDLNKLLEIEKEFPRVKKTTTTTTTTTTEADLFSAFLEISQQTPQDQ